MRQILRRTLGKQFEIYNIFQFSLKSNINLINRNGQKNRKSVKREYRTLLKIYIRSPNITK